MLRRNVTVCLCMFEPVRLRYCSICECGCAPGLPHALASMDWQTCSIQDHRPVYSPKSMILSLQL